MPRTVPPPADPALDDWQALYGAAGDFKTLAPWDWMADTDVFGVQNPATGEIGWCSVFGAAAQVYGLMVHAGTHGLAIHHAMATDQIEAEDAGYLPWRLSRDEARFLTVGLRQAVQVAGRLRDDANAVAPDTAGRFLVRVAGAAGAPWQDRRLAPPPIAHEAPPPVDELRVRRLRGRLRRETVRWECDYYHSPMIIDDGIRRPYFASLFLVVDQRSGMVLHTELGEPPLRPGALHQLFLDAIEKVGILPEEISVKRGLVHAALAPMAAGLGLSVRLTPTLPALDAARTALAAHFRRA